MGYNVPHGSTLDDLEHDRATSLILFFMKYAAMNNNKNMFCSHSTLWVTKYSLNNKNLFCILFLEK